MPEATISGHGRFSPLAAAVCAALLVPVASAGEKPVLFDPESVNFGNVRLGDSSPPAEIMVTANALFAPLFIDSVSSGSDVFAVSADQCSQVTLAGGQSCSFAVTFTPEDDSKYLSNIAVEHDSATEPSFLPVNGAGVAPLLEISPAAVDFGTLPVGQPADEIEVTLANAGSGTLTISGMDLPQPPFNVVAGTCPLPPFTLAAETQCSMALSALALQPGDYAQSVTVASDSMNDDATLSLALASWRAAGAVVVAAPDYIDFGEVPINASSTRALTVSNTGEASASLGGLFGPAPPFTVIDNQCAPYPFELAPGASCDILIAFQPSRLSHFVSPVTILSNAENGMATVTLAGGAELPRIPGLRGYGMAVLTLLLMLVGALAVRAPRLPGFTRVRSRRA